MKLLLMLCMVLLAGCATATPKEQPCLEAKAVYTAQEKAEYLMGCRKLCEEKP